MFSRVLYRIRGRSTYSHSAVELLVLRVLDTEVQRVHEFLLGDSGPDGNHCICDGVSRCILSRRCAQLCYCARETGMPWTGPKVYLEELSKRDVKFENREMLGNEDTFSPGSSLLYQSTPTVRAQRRPHSTVTSAVACTRPLGKSKMQYNQIGSAGKSRTNGRQSSQAQCNRASGLAQVEAIDNADELCSQP